MQLVGNDVLKRKMLNYLDLINFEGFPPWIVLVPKNKKKGYIFLKGIKIDTTVMLHSKLTK